MDFSTTIAGVVYTYSQSAQTFEINTDGTVITLSVPSTVAPTVVEVTQGEELEIEETDAAVTAPTNEPAAS